MYKSLNFIIDKLRFQRNASKDTLHHAKHVFILQFFPTKHTFPCCSPGIVKTSKKRELTMRKVRISTRGRCLLLLFFQRFCLSFSLNISPLLRSILLPVIFAILSCHLYTPNKEICMWYRSCQSYCTIYWPRVRHITPCMPIGVLHWDIYMKLRACQWNCLNTKRLNFVGFLMEDDKEWSFSFGV